MRKLSDIFKRHPFDDEYEQFKVPPTAIKNSDGTDLDRIANNELIINDDNELLIRRGNEIKEISGKTTAEQRTIIRSGGSSGTTLTKATGSDINTGTNDTNYVTPKAIEDSNLARTTDIPAAPLTGIMTLDVVNDSASWLELTALTLAVSANTSYFVELSLMVSRFNSDATGNVRFTLPSGATIILAGFENSSNYKWDGSSRTFGETMYVMTGKLVVSTTAGDCKIQIYLSAGVVVYARAGSSIRLTKI